MNIELNCSVLYFAMKIKLRILSVALLGATVSSCTTTYDAYGNPQQSVDPAMAAAGVVAAGLIGAAIADNNNDDRRFRRHPGYYNSNHGNFRRGNFRRGRW